MIFCIKELSGMFNQKENSLVLDLILEINQQVFLRSFKSSQHERALGVQSQRSNPLCVTEMNDCKQWSLLLSRL